MNHILALLLVGIVGAFGMGLLTGPLMVGYMRMVLKESEGQTTSAGDVFKGFDDFVPGFLVGLLGSILISAGYMFCIVPGLLLAPILPFALYLVATGEKDGIAALKRGFELLQKNLVGAALCAFVLSCVGGLGVLGCFLGVFVTAPIAAIGTVQMCKQVVDADSSVPARA